MFKNAVVGVLISIGIVFVFIISLEGLAKDNRIAALEEDVAAHKLAMSLANTAIHTFYDKSRGEAVLVSKL